MKPEVIDNALKSVKDYVFKMIDKWVEETLDEIINKKQVQKRGLWDRFKGGVSNLMYGRNDKNNPYYYLNKFGDQLGQKESYSPRISLKTYLEIKECFETEELYLNEAIDSEAEKLSLVKTIRASANNLKNKLSNVFDKMGKFFAPAPSPASEPPASEPPASEPPASEPPASEPPASEPPASEPPAPEPPAPEPPAPEPPAPKKGRKTNSELVGSSIESAVSAKKNKDTDSLTPKSDWLEKSGRIKLAKLPFVIAWMSSKSHLEALNPEHIQEELANLLGMKKDKISILPKIAGSKKIEDYMKSYLPQVSDEEFKRSIDELTKQTDLMDGADSSSSSADTSRASNDSVRADSSSSSSSDTSRASNDEPRAGLSMTDYDNLIAGKPRTRPMEIESQPKDIFKEIYSKLIEGVKGRNEIIEKLERKLITPTFNSVFKTKEEEPTAEEQKVINWWINKKNHFLSDQQTEESLMTYVTSGALVNELIETLDGKVSKNKILEILKKKLKVD